MKNINMNGLSPSEIISHLEIYGDGCEGNVLRAIKSLREEADSANEYISELEQFTDIEDLECEIEDLECEIEDLKGEIADLKETISEIEKEK